jgi:hypothetical protein
MMGGTVSALVLWLLFVALGFYVLYVVIRRAVRDGIRDAADGVPPQASGSFEQAPTTDDGD